MDRWHSPGAAVAVVSAGKVVLAEGYGQANRERALQTTPGTKFHLGSVSKQFTAAAVMLLVEDGKVSLDERAAKYLAKLPGPYRSITVRQLLQHTSGIRRDLRDDDGNSLVGDALFHALAKEALAFKPGERAGYSNTDYVLLGMLVEAVSGKPCGEFQRSRIFAPLGMESTRYVESDKPVPGLATGYTWMEGRFEPVTFVPRRFGAGDLVSTVLDLAKWDAALSGGTLLRPSSLETMSTGARLNDGSPAVIGADDAGRLLESAMGWHLSIDLGHRVVHHGGNIDGYSSQVERFVDDRVTVIVLANNEAHAAINIARPVIERYVPALDRSGAASLAQLGRVAYGEGDFAAGARLFVAALEKGDTAPTTAFNAARCHARLGRIDDGFVYLAKAAALGYQDAERLASEVDLAMLRRDPRWRQVADQVAANRGRAAGRGS